MRKVNCGRIDHSLFKQKLPVKLHLKTLGYYRAAGGSHLHGALFPPPPPPRPSPVLLLSFLPVCPAFLQTVAGLDLQSPGSSLSLTHSQKPGCPHREDPVRFVLRRLRTDSSLGPEHSRPTSPDPLPPLCSPGQFSLFLRTRSARLSSLCLEAPTTAFQTHLPSTCCVPGLRDV